MQANVGENLEFGVLRVRRRTLLGDLRQQQRVFAHALNRLQQVAAQIHSISQLYLLCLSHHCMQSSSRVQTNRGGLVLHTDTG